MKDYLNHKLTFLQDKILDEDGHSVMMSWETPIMEKVADIITQKGGKILNIGFGMGIVDGFIQSKDIEEHWIVEPHPDILQKMKDGGWYDKPNVKIVESTWEDCIDSLPKFDGIYFDIWGKNEYFTFDVLFSKVKKILHPSGIFTFWFGENHKTSPKHLDLFEKNNFDVKWKSVVFKDGEVPSANEQFVNGDGFYFSPNTKVVFIPILTNKC